MVKVTFLHPDLGIGGAERLVVDAALALKKKGHQVEIVTTHFDRNRCFDETKDGTLPVKVIGSWLPRHIFGKFFALCAYIRMIYAAVCLFFMGDRPDVVFCDLVSICVPILRLFVRRVIFYCHYPDQLLSKPGNRLKAIYRAPLNYLEEVTTGQADQIFVNSNFTLSIFKITFTRVNIQPDILYPTIHTDYFDDTDNIPPLSQVLNQDLPKDSLILLSINRYEVKKNLKLAIDVIFELKNHLNDEQYRRTYLIMAGGYDQRVDENVQHFKELVSHANDLQVENKVIFLRSPSDQSKVSLLNNCSLLIYTPPNEHFGIVPLEAMYFQKPVVAHKSGGPMETILNDITGYLIPELSGPAFAKSISILLKDENKRKTFGEAAKNRVINTFSFSAFADKLNKTVNTLTNDSS